MNRLISTPHIASHQGLVMAFHTSCTWLFTCYSCLRRRFHISRLLAHEFLLLHHIHLLSWPNGHIMALHSTPFNILILLTCIFHGFAIHYSIFPSYFLISHFIFAEYFISIHSMVILLYFAILLVSHLMFHSNFILHHTLAIHLYFILSLFIFLLLAISYTHSHTSGYFISHHILNSHHGRSMSVEEK
jgi:hypothetical protein